MKNQRKYRRPLALSAVVLFCLFASAKPARAELALQVTIANSFSPLGGFRAEVEGWEFTPTADLTIEAMGLFDWRGGGLSTSHPVGLWVKDNPSSPVATVTVPSFAQSDLVLPAPSGAWRLQNLQSPVTALADTTYVIGVFGPQGTQELSINGPTAIFDPVVGFNPNREYGTSSLTTINALEYPSFTQAGAPNLGANFTYTVVPEPGSAVGLAMLGCVCLTNLRRRK